MRVILWDFDGVIMNSNEVRDLGFEKVLADFDKQDVEKLLEFHRQNGGLSRYVKFKYFFEDVLGEPTLTEEKLTLYTEKFSSIMKTLLTNKELLIEETVEFIKKQSAAGTPMHIVSGSDQKELRFLCEQLGIDQYFKSIHGSPTPKKQLVANVIDDNGYMKQDCLLIGDSNNDFEAAEHNNIEFYGYNNQNLRKHDNYITSFKNLKLFS